MSKDFDWRLVVVLRSYNLGTDLIRGVCAVVSTKVFSLPFCKLKIKFKISINYPILIKLFFALNYGGIYWMLY
jgi:hypothetical protein